MDALELVLNQGVVEEVISSEGGNDVGIFGSVKHEESLGCEVSRRTDLRDRLLSFIFWLALSAEDRLEKIGRGRGGL